jgi:hypothetical protein
VAKLISWHQSRWNWRYPVSAVSFSSLPSTPNDHGRSRFSHWSTGIYKWMDKDRWINNFKIIWIELIQSQNGSCGINMVALNRHGNDTRWPRQLRTWTSAAKLGGWAVTSRCKNRTSNID